VIWGLVWDHNGYLQNEPEMVRVLYRLETYAKYRR
jgi:hypothetical protein